MTRATESAMAELHSALAQALLARVRSGEASAADLSAAAKFLKDNEITVSPEQSAEMAELQERMEAQRARRAARMKATVADLEEARQKALRHG